MTTSEPRTSLFGIALGLAAVVIFGMTLPASRIAVAELSPVIVGLGRAAIAAMVAGIAIALAGAPRPARDQWKDIVIIAFGVVLGFPLLSAIAMQYAPAAHGAVVLALLPLATATAAVIFAGERPSLGFWICGTLGAGCVVAFALRKSGAEAHLADLLLVAATLGAAVGYAVSGRLSRTMNGWHVISWALIVALPVTVPATLFALPHINWNASFQAWAGLAYVALFSQFIGFFFWNRAMAISGVAKVGQLQLLQPFVTLVGAAAIVGEAIEPATVLFALAVVILVAAGQRMRVATRVQ